MGVFKQKYLNYFLVAITHLAVILPFKSAHGKEAKGSQLTSNNIAPTSITVPTHEKKSQRPQLTQQSMDFILTRAYFPLLKQNEGERLYFYRCTAKKVTAGYGSNVEDNPNLLDTVQIYHNKKVLNKDEKNHFVQMCTTFSDEELKEYTISKKDAERMAYISIGQAIQSLRNVPLWHFDSLPIIAKSLLLDIRLNIGPVRLQKFRRFQIALKNGDWKNIASECTVFYRNPKTKKVSTNPLRETRKQLLCKLSSLINSSNSTTEVFEALNKMKLTKSQQALLQDKNELLALETMVYFALMEKPTLTPAKGHIQVITTADNKTK